MIDIIRAQQSSLQFGKHLALDFPQFPFRHLLGIVITETHITSFEFLTAVMKTLVLSLGCAEKLKWYANSTSSSLDYLLYFSKAAKIHSAFPSFNSYSFLVQQFICRYFQVQVQVCLNHLLPNGPIALKPRACLTSPLVILQYSHPGPPCRRDSNDGLKQICIFK